MINRSGWYEVACAYCEKSIGMVPAVVHNVPIYCSRTCIEVVEAQAILGGDLTFKIPIITDVVRPVPVVVEPPLDPPLEG